VQWIVKRVGFGGLKTEGSNIRTLVGWVWVTVVIWTGMPLVGDTFLRMRMGVEPLLPNSFSRDLVEKWVPIPPL
jgi:hypothetical protein